MHLVLISTVPLIFLILASSFVCMVSRRPFGIVLPAVCLSIPAVLFFTQFLFRSFLPGTILLLLPAAAALPLYLAAKPEVRAARRNHIISPGFYTLLAVWVIFLVIDMRRNLVKWDELMTWGMMVKEMLRTDRFYTEPVSNLLRHKDYPPFMGLLQLFWCRLCGGYTEMGVSMASHIFNFSLLAGPLSELLWDHSRDGAALTSGAGTDPGDGIGRPTAKTVRKNLAGAFFFVLILVTVLLAFDPFHILMTVYPDITEAIVFAYAMHLVYTGDAAKPGIGLLCFVLALLNLVGIKQIGISFLMLCLLYLFLTLCAEGRRGSGSGAPGSRTEAPGFRSEAQESRTGWLCLLISAAASFFSMFLWKQYTGQFELERQFDLSGMDLRALTGIAGGALGSNAGAVSGISVKDTLVRFVLALFETNIWNGWIPITFASSLLLALLAAALLHRGNREAFPVRRGVVLGIVFAVGTAGYAAMMLVLYLFCFEENETLNFISYPRYMGSWLAGVMLVLLLIAAELYRDRLRRFRGAGKLALVWLAAATLLNPSGLLYFVPQKLHGNPRGQFREIAQRITDQAEPGSSVFLVSDSTSDDTQLFTAYYADGIRISMEDIHAYHYNYQAEPELASQVAESMGHNDYVYVVRAGEAMREAFSEAGNAGEAGNSGAGLLPEGAVLEDETLYRVVKSPEGIRLEKTE